MLAEASSPVATVLTIVIGAALYIVTVAATAVALSNIYRAGIGHVPPSGSTAENADGQPIQPSDVS